MLIINSISIHSSIYGSGKFPYSRAKRGGKPRTHFKVTLICLLLTIFSVFLGSSAIFTYLGKKYLVSHSV